MFKTCFLCRDFTLISNVSDITPAFVKFGSNSQLLTDYIQNITDESIIAITKNCINLNKLHIDNCENIKENSFESIAINCKNLKYLYIQINEHLYETEIIKIIKNCLKLKEIKIKNCSKISKKFTIREILKDRSPEWSVQQETEDRGTC